MQCSKSLLKGEQTYSAPLNWHSHCTSSFSRQLVRESSVANGASAWSLVRMVVGGAMRVDCLICDRWVFLSFSFPLFSPPVSRPSLSVYLSYLQLVFFSLSRYRITYCAAEVWMSGIYTLLQRIFVHNGVCVCCEAVCFLTWLFACLCVMVTFVRSEPHKMACRHSLQLKIKHIWLFICLSVYTRWTVTRTLTCTISRLFREPRSLKLFYMPACFM